MKKLIFWIPPVLWMGIIFYFSSRQRVEVSESYVIQFLFFKTLHLIEYGLLYVLLYRAFRNTRKGPEWKHQIDAFLFAVMYGVLDEIHQKFVPTREGRMRDVFIDALGVSLALWFLWKYIPQAPKKLKHWARKLQLT